MKIKINHRGISSLENKRRRKTTKATTYFFNSKQSRKTGIKQHIMVRILLSMVNEAYRPCKRK
jgi:hypothetical protein